jgi:hypothetical protein
MVEQNPSALATDDPEKVCQLDAQNFIRRASSLQYTQVQKELSDTRSRRRKSW